MISYQCWQWQQVLWGAEADADYFHSRFFWLFFPSFLSLTQWREVVGGGEASADNTTGGWTTASLASSSFHHSDSLQSRDQRTTERSASQASELLCKGFHEGLDNVLVVTDDEFITANYISCVHAIGPLFDNATIQMNQIWIIKSKREWSKKQNGSEGNSSGKRQGVVTFWSQFVLPVHQNA